MKLMAVIVLVVFAIVFLGGAIQIAVSLLRRKPLPDAPGAILGLALVLIGIGRILQWLSGADSFFADLANILGGIGLAWWVALEIKRNLGQSKPVELRLGNSEKTTSGSKRGA